MPRSKSLLALLSVVGALAAAPPLASAATVANTNDSGPGSLRQTVIDALPTETVNLPAGTYTLTSGPIAIDKPLSIAGAGAAATAIRGGNFRAFQVTGSGVGVTISGVTFRDFVLTGESIAGGIVFANLADLTLNGVAFTANAVQANGPERLIQGGLLLNIAGDLAILDSRIAGNTFTATGTGGQGAAQGAAVLADPGSGGSFTMTGTSISNNLVDLRGEGSEGGLAQGGVLTISGEASSRATIRSSAIVANSIDVRGGAGGGGAIGGALLAVNGGVEIVGTTIAANLVRASADAMFQGGGAAVLTSPELPISITGSTIAANGGPAAAGEGNGGGNLFLSGQVSFADTVVAGGIGPAGSENCALASIVPTSRGFNLDSRDQCGFHGPGDQVNRDPQLGPVADNGGPTPTMLPAPTSPLVDQGASFGLAADQRGLPRPIDFPAIPNAPGGDGSDIGAVELQPSAAFTIGKLKKNRRKGTARLTVNLPGLAAGVVTLTGKGLKARRVAVGASPMITFVVAAKGKVGKALRRKGRRKVAIKVTYTPAGAAAVTQTRKTKLVRVKPRPKGAKEKPSKART